MKTNLPIPFTFVLYLCNNICLNVQLEGIYQRASMCFFFIWCRYLIIDIQSLGEIYLYFSPILRESWLLTIIFCVKKSVLHIRVFHALTSVPGLEKLEKTTRFELLLRIQRAGLIEQQLFFCCCITILASLSLDVYKFCTNLALNIDALVQSVPPALLPTTSQIVRLFEKNLSVS